MRAVQKPTMWLVRDHHHALGRRTGERFAPTGSQFASEPGPAFPEVPVNGRARGRGQGGDLAVAVAGGLEQHVVLLAWLERGEAFAAGGVQLGVQGALEWVVVVGEAVA